MVFFSFAKEHHALLHSLSLSLSLSLACATNERCARLYQYLLLLSRNDDDVGQNPKKKQAEEAGKRAKAAKASSEREDDSGPPKKSPGEIRLAKGIYNYYSSSFSEDFLTTIILLLPDLAELKLEKGMAIKFPNGKSDLMNFRIEIKPSENYWRGGTFTFTFKVPDSYPHEPPKVLCDQKVYHPNLDTQGNICLNVLREDWSPVQTVTSVIFGLLFLFIDPNASDPLNSEAAKDLMQSTANFKANVRKAMMGGSINGVRFTKVM